MMEPSSIYTDELRYYEDNPMNYIGHPHYDSCYYEITAREQDVDSLIAEGIDPGRIKLELYVTNSTEMNIYLYGGSSRWQATENIIPQNARAVVGQKYKIDYQIGMVLVAYPNAEVDTRFGFAYRIMVEEDPNAQPEVIEEAPEETSPGYSP